MAFIFLHPWKSQESVLANLPKNLIERIINKQFFHGAIANFFIGRFANLIDKIPLWEQRNKDVRGMIFIAYSMFGSLLILFRIIWVTTVSIQWIYRAFQAVRDTSLFMSERKLAFSVWWSHLIRLRKIAWCGIIFIQISRYPFLCLGCFPVFWTRFLTKLMAGYNSAASDKI